MKQRQSFLSGPPHAHPHNQLCQASASTTPLGPVANFHCFGRKYLCGKKSEVNAAIFSQAYLRTRSHMGQVNAPPTALGATLLE